MTGKDKATPLSLTVNTLMKLRMGDQESGLNKSKRWKQNKEHRCYL